MSTPPTPPKEEVGLCPVCERGACDAGEPYSSAAAAAEADSECYRLGYERLQRLLREGAQEKERLIKERDEAIAAQAERERYIFGPLGDNHHNAARCPYCGDPLGKAESRAAALEADAALYGDSARAWTEEAKRLGAEVERLRDAMRNIVEHWDGYEEAAEEYDDPKGLAFLNAARAALAAPAKDAGGQRGQPSAETQLSVDHTGGSVPADHGEKSGPNGQRDPGVGLASSVAPAVPTTGQPLPAEQLSPAPAPSPETAAREALDMAEIAMCAHGAPMVPTQVVFDWLQRVRAAASLEKQASQPETATAHDPDPVPICPVLAGGGSCEPCLRKIMEWQERQRTAPSPTPKEK